jgi:hypothetical protein
MAYPHSSKTRTQPASHIPTRRPLAIRLHKGSCSHLRLVGRQDLAPFPPRHPSSAPALLLCADRSHQHLPASATGLGVCHRVCHPAAPPRPLLGWPLWLPGRMVLPSLPSHKGLGICIVMIVTSSQSIRIPINNNPPNERERNIVQTAREVRCATYSINVLCYSCAILRAQSR